jgi:hypothetical protein
MWHTWKQQNLLPPDTSFWAWNGRVLILLVLYCPAILPCLPQLIMKMLRHAPYGISVRPGTTQPTKTSLCFVWGVISKSKAEKADSDDRGQGRGERHKHNRLMGSGGAGKCEVMVWFVGGGGGGGRGTPATSLVVEGWGWWAVGRWDSGGKCQG